jgi:DHA1 family multidrug resistance protein-like MFS transporter
LGLARRRDLPGRRPRRTSKARDFRGKTQQAVIPRTFLSRRFDLPSGPLAILMGLVFLKQIGNGMIWSVIALYGQELGAGPTVIGLLVSCYGGARLMANLPSGLASERFGRRRMMQIGCVLLALASFGVVLTHSIEAFFVGVLLLGMASASFMTAALAAVADLGTPGQRLRDASFYQAANMTGTALGPALGGLIAASWGYSAPYFVNGLIALAGVAAFVLIPWPKENRVTGPQEATGSVRAIAAASAGVGLMYFAIFYARTASNWIVMPLIAQSQFGWDMAAIGMLLTAGACANLVVLPFNAMLSRAFGRVGSIIIAGLATFAACALLAFGHHPVFLWLTAIMFGAGSGIATPTLIAYVAEVAPDNQRGLYMGLLRTSQDFALILGPFFTGVLSDHLGFGYQGGLMGSMVILIASILVFWRGAKSRNF